MAKTSDTLNDIYQQKDIPNHDKTPNFLAELHTGCHWDWFDIRPLHVNGSCSRPNERDGICEVNTTISFACDESDSISFGSIICVGVDDWDFLVYCNHTREQI